MQHIALLLAYVEGTLVTEQKVLTERARATKDPRRRSSGTFSASISELLEQLGSRPPVGNKQHWPDDAKTGGTYR